VEKNARGWSAETTVGRVGADQAAPRKEF
jgi:hypothetical protein